MTHLGRQVATLSPEGAAAEEEEGWLGCKPPKPLLLLPSPGDVPMLAAAAGLPHTTPSSGKPLRWLSVMTMRPGSKAC